MFFWSHGFCWLEKYARKVGLAKVWFYTLCPDRPEGVRAGQHNLPVRLAKTNFQSGLASFYKVIWSRNQNIVMGSAGFGKAYKTDPQLLLFCDEALADFRPKYSKTLEALLYIFVNK